MRVVLLRHAPTRGNLERRYVGATDEPLCPEGVELAASLARTGAGPGAVYASPRLRARQTARALFPDAEVHVVAGLEEMDFGAFEGKTYLELSDDAGYRAWVDGGCTGQVPGGESRETFCRRVADALSALLDRAAQDPPRPGPLVVVAHGGTVMAALSTLGGDPGSYWDWRAPFCGGYEARAEMTCSGWVLRDARAVGPGEV